LRLVRSALITARHVVAGGAAVPPAARARRLV